MDDSPSSSSSSSSSPSWRRRKEGGSRRHHHNHEEEEEEEEESMNDENGVARFAAAGEREEERIEEVLTRKRSVKRRDASFVHMNSSSVRYSRTIIRRAGKRALRETLTLVKDLNKRKRHLPVLMTEMEALAKRTRNEIPALLVPPSHTKRNNLMGGKNDLELAIAKFRKRAAVTRKLRDYLESESAGRYAELLRLRADVKDAEEEERGARLGVKTVKELSEMVGGMDEAVARVRLLGGGDLLGVRSMNRSSARRGPTLGSSTTNDALSKFLDSQIQNHT